MENVQFVTCKGTWINNGSYIKCNGQYQTFSTVDLQIALFQGAPQLTLAQRGELIGSMIVFFVLICVFKRLIKQASYS